MRRSFSIRLATASLLAWPLACATDLQLGERHYREGDRLAALETWRHIPVDNRQYAEARRRIAEVEREFEQLVERYKQRGHYYESRERLAESILNYRLALKLQPDDRETLALVQRLARDLATRKRETLAAFRRDLEAPELAGAREKLDTLGGLDPFDPDLETERRQFNQALLAETERLMVEGRRGLAGGQLGAAEQAFRRVLELDPENESARGYLSYVTTLRSAGQVTQGGSLDPSLIFATEQEIRAEGFYQSALAADRAGDPYAALRHDLSALRANPEHDQARRHLAELRTRLAPEVEVLIERGREHYLQEDLQSALDQWRRALLIDPGNQRAREYAERADRMLENLQRLRSDPQVSTR